MLWNESMFDWLELSELPDMKKKLEQPAPPPKRTPSIAPPQPPTVVEQQQQQQQPEGEDWVVVKDKEGKKETEKGSSPRSSEGGRSSMGGSPVLVQKPVAGPTTGTAYTDDGDEYNNIGLKKVGYSDEGGGREDYTPGWTLSDDTRDKVMQVSVCEERSNELTRRFLSASMCSADKSVRNVSTMSSLAVSNLIIATPLLRLSSLIADIRGRRPRQKGEKWRSHIMALARR